MYEYVLKNLDEAVAAIVTCGRTNSMFLKANEKTINPTKTTTRQSVTNTCTPRRLKVGVWNVESMSRRASEVVKTTNICIANKFN